MQGTPVVEELSQDELERQIALYGPLADVVRGLVDASVRTEVDAEVVRDVTEVLRSQLDRLRARQSEDPFGIRWTTLGKRRAWGNAVLGLRNPIAPPLQLQSDPDGRVWADFELGAAYEGPHHLTHGGVSALILDQVLGAAAEVGNAPGMTGTITVRYVRATPLGALRAEARMDRIEGVKTYVTGHISSGGEVCVEAEAVFILPANVRELFEERRRELRYDPTTLPNV